MNDVVSLFMEGGEFDELIKNSCDARETLVNDLTKAFEEFKASRCFNCDETIVAPKQVRADAKQEFDKFKAYLKDFYKAYRKIYGTYVINESVEETNDYIKGVIKNAASAVKDIKHDKELTSQEKKREIMKVVSQKGAAVKRAMQGLQDAFDDFVRSIKNGTKPKNEYKIMCNAVKLFEQQYTALIGYTMTKHTWAIDWNELLGIPNIFHMYSIWHPHAKKLGPISKHTTNRRIDKYARKIVKLKLKRDDA